MVELKPFSESLSVGLCLLECIWPMLRMPESSNLSAEMCLNTARIGNASRIKLSRYDFHSADQYGGGNADGQEHRQAEDPLK